MMGLEEIIGLEVISSDARVIGTVEGVGVDMQRWRAPALNVGLRRGVEDLVGIKHRLFSVEKVYLKTEDLEAISDTIIMKMPLSAVGEAVSPDQEAITPAGSFMGLRVILSNARYIGMVDNMLFDPENDWAIPSLQVKLDRGTVDDLNMQRSFRSAPVVPVRTADIRAIGDMVMMNMDMEQLKTSVRDSISTRDSPPPPPGAPGLVPSDHEDDHPEGP